MKQEPQSNIINYGLPAKMYTKTEAFDQHLFLSKSGAAIHYSSHYHRQRSFNERFTVYFRYFLKESKPTVVKQKRTLATILKARHVQPKNISGATSRQTATVHPMLQGIKLSGKGRGQS